MVVQSGFPAENGFGEPMAFPVQSSTYEKKTGAFKLLTQDVPQVRPPCPPGKRSHVHTGRETQKKN